MEIEIARSDYYDGTKAVIERYGSDPGFLIPMLQDIQSHFGYVPREALEVVAEALHVPLSQCYAVATFYTSISLAPRGRHIITLCLGTVCYLKGGRDIGESIQRALSVAPGGTTSDGLFTFQPVNCLGACALAPVLVVDDEYFDKVKLRQVPDILAKYSTQEKSGDY
jgi:NADH-quinone oxidoreductase subunit E